MKRFELGSHCRNPLTGFNLERFLLWRSGCGKMVLARAEDSISSEGIGGKRGSKNFSNSMTDE
jgi:hypothetical protein